MLSSSLSRSVRVTTRSTAVLALLTGALLMSPAAAAIKTWSPVNTDFNDGANWLGGLPASADMASFTGAATTQPNVTAPISISGIDFQIGSSGYLLSSSGSSITLVSTSSATAAAAYSGRHTAGTNTISSGLILGATAGSTQYFNLATGGTTVFNGVISGGGATNTLAISNNGAIFLNGANTYSGTTTFFNNGGVFVGNKSAFGTSTVRLTATKSFTINADLTGANAIANNLTLGGNLSLANTVFGVEFSGNVDLAGAGRTIALGANTTGITFSGVISNDGGAGLTFIRGDGASNAVLTGLNTYTGPTSVQGVGVSVSNIGNAGFASNLGTSGTIVLGAAGASQAVRLLYTGTGETTDKVISLNTSSGGISIDTTGATGALVFSSNLVATSGAARTLTLTGNTLGNTINGNIVDPVGTGTISLTKTGSGTWILGGNNTYSGSTTITGGILQFNSAGAIAGVGRTVNLNNAGAAGAAGYAIDQAFLDRFTLGSIGAVALGANSSNNLNFAGFTQAFYLGSTGDFTYSGSYTPATSIYRFGGGGGNLTVSSALSGANTMVINGPGRVILTGVNTQSGATSILTGATLQGRDTTAYAGNATVNSVFGTNVLSPSGTSNLELRANGQNDSSAQTLTFANGIQASTGGQVMNVNVDRASGSGTGKTIALGLLNFAIPASGTTTLNVTGSNGYRLMASGANALTLGGAGTTGSVLLNPTSASLILNGNVSNSGSVGTYTKTLILGGTSTGNVISGTILNATGTGLTAVTKAGSSTWSLNGTSTYTGATDVTAGTLLINGALGNTTVTVSGNAILGGSGTLAGALNVTGSSSLSLGNSPGVLTVNNDVTLSDDSMLVMELNGTSAGQFDRLVINGSGNDFTLSGGNVTLSLVLGYTPQIGDSFTLVNITGSGVISGIFDNLVSSGTITVGATQFKANDFGASNDLILTVVPEPQALGLITMGLSLALYGYRRRHS